MNTIRAGRDDATKRGEIEADNQNLPERQGFTTKGVGPAIRARASSADWSTRAKIGGP